MIEEFYPLGETPPLGEVPQLMLANCIRKSRYGEPKDAIKIEKIPVPAELKPHEVLVYIMAVGVNYNGIWVSSGLPVDMIDYCNKKGYTEDFHIPGSDAAGVVWKIGSAVKNVKIGDEVIIHGCRWDYEDPHIKAGKDPVLAPSMHIWGYETIYGGLAQYTRVQDHQCLPKANHLTWAEAGSFMGSGAAAYRMLYNWSGNIVQENDPVLIWGGAGGLGCMGIQICKVAGARPVAVVSDPQKFDYCLNLGAVGVINRKEFNHWGMLPHWQDEEKYNAWVKEARRFGKAFWEALGEKRNPVIVFEHPGEDTTPTSCFMVETGGMVVTCAGTTGYNGTIDLRYHWMRQKRVQGSHFANDEQCAATSQLVADGKVDPCVSRVFQFEETAEAHQLMHLNRHPSGKMVILVNALSRDQQSLNS